MSRVAFQPWPKFVKPESDVCVRPGGAWPEWPGRSCWNCDSKNRAAVCGELSMVDIAVSWYLVSLSLDGRNHRSKNQGVHPPGSRNAKINSEEAPVKLLRGKFVDG